jgi:hypothetical protein
MKAPSSYRTAVLLVRGVQHICSRILDFERTPERVKAFRDVLLEVRE